MECALLVLSRAREPAPRGRLRSAHDPHCRSSLGEGGNVTRATNLSATPAVGRLLLWCMEHCMEHVSRGPRPVLLVLLAISTSLLEPLMLANTITKLDCDQLLAVLCCGASFAVVIMDTVTRCATRAAQNGQCLRGLSCTHLHSCSTCRSLMLRPTATTCWSSSAVASLAVVIVIPTRDANRTHTPA
jgi:hypothetical protein